MADDRHQTTDLRWRRMALTRMERDALREAQSLAAKGRTMGRRRIVSMQGLEEAGLVQRVERGGVIVDWMLTSEGAAHG